MKVKVVFFDAGDTLLCPQPSFPGLAAAVLRERGHDVEEDDVREASKGLGEHFKRVEGKALTAAPEGNRAFWIGVYADILVRLGIADEGAPGALVDRFSDPASYELYPEALPVLTGLREADIRLGVISNFEPWLRTLLERLGVTELFDVVAISGELGWEKPDERIFRWAVEQTGVRPDECVHVGDQPYFDAEPALALGIRPVLIDHYGRFEDLDASYPRITALVQLPGVLAGMVRP